MAVKGKFVDVELARVKPNPLRDREIDPVSEEDLGALLTSIKADGYWSGTVGRKNQDGEIELGAGQRRTIAAMKAGVTRAPIFIGDFDDAAMIRIYCEENFTQRDAEDGVAMAGAVASAVRYLTKALLKDDKAALSQIYDSAHAIEKAREALASEKQGLGASCILKFFKGMGIKESQVTHHMAGLKSSGNYARILKEVTEEIAQEHALELAELERKQREAEAAKKAEEAARAKAKKEKAEKKQQESAKAGKKATEAASKKKVTFDLTGVSKHIKTQHPLRVFREIVERESYQKFLPLDQQAGLAAKLVQAANSQNKGELTGTFVKDYMTVLMMEAAQEQGRLDAAARKELEERDLHEKWTRVSHEFARNVGQMHRNGHTLLELLEKHRDIKFHINQELRNAVRYAVPTINKLAEKIQR
jgi:ParB/RepB/Spo0J family partition protein